VRRRPASAGPWAPPADEDGYRGPAEVAVAGTRVRAEVHLAGHLEPLDGRYHWYGRITRHDALVAAKEAGATEVRVAVGDAAPATGRLAELDAWGNLRVTGTGRPPYPLEPVEVDLPAE